MKAEFPGALLCIGSEDAPMLTNGVKNLSVLLGVAFVNLALAATAPSDR